MNLLGRRFRVWEYRVSHDQMLIRSPRSERHPRNVDLIFTGVEYIELATMLEDVVVADPSREDLERTRAVYKADVRSDYVRVLVSRNRRYIVVAAGMKVEENSLDLFETSLETFR